MTEKHSVIACRKHLRHLDKQLLELDIAMGQNKLRSDSDEADLHSHFEDLELMHRQLSKRREAARLLLSALTNLPSNCATFN